MSRLLSKLLPRIYGAGVDWETYEREVIGTVIRGDREIPSTYPFTELALSVFVWRLVALFDVPPEHCRNGYRVGVRRFNKPWLLSYTPMSNERFGVLVGREDFRIIVTNPYAKEAIDVEEADRWHYTLVSRHRIPILVP